MNDRCLIQTRGVDTSGMTDNETWTAQAKPTRCRAMKSINKRKTSPGDAEKIQYGTYVYLILTLPASAQIAAHDRVVYPVQNGLAYDVIGLSAPVDARGKISHYVATCDVRA